TAQAQPTTVIPGDALDLLPGLINEIPTDVVPCVFHAATLNQFTKEGRARLAAILDEHGRRRRLCRIGAEGTMKGTGFELRLYSWNQGEARLMTLALCHGHGQWIEWKV